MNGREKIREIKSEDKENEGKDVRGRQVKES